MLISTLTNMNSQLYYLQELILIHFLFVRFYAAELVCGIQFLHSKGVIHRDLKPENILVADTGHIKIMDYGLALDNMHGDRTATSYAGTMGYMAPEMLDKKEYNAGVDWYSFGVILNKMLPSKSAYHRTLSDTSSSGAKDIIKQSFTQTFSDNLQSNYTFTLYSFEIRSVRFLCFSDHRVHLLNSKYVSYFQLLQKDPVQRLGVNGNIREHQFFQCIDWVSVEALRMDPPYIPVVSNVLICHLDQTYIFSNTYSPMYVNYVQQCK
ncbi:protein kinase C delta type-like [Anomaloglossus baeobatrachus]